MKKRWTFFVSRPVASSAKRRLGPVFTLRLSSGHRHVADPDFRRGLRGKYPLLDYDYRTQWQFYDIATICCFLPRVRDRMFFIFSKFCSFSKRGGGG